MDLRESQEPHQPSRRRGRSRKPSPAASTPPEGASEAKFTAWIGKVGEIVQYPSGYGVWIVGRPNQPDVLVAVELFPSVDWLRRHVGRWVMCSPSRPGRGMLVPDPAGFVEESRDELTGLTVMACKLCGREVGRLNLRAPQERLMELLEGMSKDLSEHIRLLHPEILEAFTK